MGTTAYYINLLRQNINTLRIDYGVEQMYLFGSVARGQQTAQSDVDVCVDMPVNPFLRLKLRDFLQSKLGCPVDVVRRHNNMNTVLQKQINKDGIRIF